MRNLILLFLFLIANCGFKAIYNESSDSQNLANYEDELATIRIQKDSGQLAQELRTELYDILNPDLKEAEAKYLLILKINKAITSTFTTLQGASGRNKVVITTEYELKEVKTARLVAKGSTFINDNYNIQTNRYGTYVAEDFVRSNLMKNLAKNLRNLLVNDIIEMSKTPDHRTPEVIELTKEKVEESGDETTKNVELLNEKNQGF